MSLVRRVKDIEQRLAKYCKESVMNCYVVGLSGGIDSAVSAAVAVAAVGKENVYGIILPCALPNEDHRVYDEKDAMRVAKHLGIKTTTISLHKQITSFTSFVSTRLAIANIKARLRMVVLRAIAEEKKALVLGTTNRVEDMLGYFTKGADGGSGVDIEPLIGFYKLDIVSLCAYFGFPVDIINRESTAGLRDQQTDVTELGLSYDLIDAYCRAYDALWKELLYDEHLLTPTLIKEICEKIDSKKIGISDLQAEKLVKLLLQARHKRVMPPSFSL